MTARTTTMQLAQSTPSNEQWAAISFAIIGIGGIIASVTMWLDKRAKAILADGTAELRKEVEALRLRVVALEDGNREARGYIIDAITLVSASGNGADIITALKKAQGILH